MEGFRWARWAVMKRCWAAKREGFRATRLTVRASNGLQMERKLTGGLPTLKQHRMPSFIPFREHFYATHGTRSKRCNGCVWECRNAKRTTGKMTECKFWKIWGCNADDDMAKCNTQENDMAMTMNKQKTPGASDPGRYNTPPLIRDLVPRS